RFERVGDYLDADGNFLALVRIDGIAPGDTLLGSQLARAITGLQVSPIPAEATQI
ncbi:MAG: RND transporter, partial [Pseudomonadales bacterium]|nr:RND transporter [Pseudomonadales bacterium]